MASPKATLYPPCIQVDFYLMIMTISEAITFPNSREHLPKNSQSFLAHSLNNLPEINKIRANWSPVQSPFSQNKKG